MGLLDRLRSTRSDGIAIAAAAQRIDLSDRSEAARRYTPQPWQCADAETQALTRAGWRSYADLRVGDEVMALDPERGTAVWSRVTALNVYPVTEAEVLALDGRLHSSVTTLNHRWPVLRRNTGTHGECSLLDCPQPVVARGWCSMHHRRWLRHGDPEATQRHGINRARRDRPLLEPLMVTSTELRPAHLIRTAAPAADLPTEAKFTDAFVELVAWFWTEGTARASGRYIAITQSRSANPTYVARIREALTVAFGPQRARGGSDGWRESSDGDMAVFAINGAPASALLDVAPARVVRPDFILALTRSQLELFISTSVDADGWRDATASMVTQSAPERLDALELAAILTGRTPHTYEPKPGVTRLHLRDTTTVAPLDAAANRANPGRATADRRTYTGVVWCPTTTTGTWLARRRGTVYFTGNSDAWVYRDAVGELRMALDWLAGIMSRLRVQLAVVVDPTQPPVPLADALAPREGEGDDAKPLVTDLPASVIEAAEAAVAALAGGGVGHGHLLSPLTVNHETVGECYLLGRMTELGEEWSIRSMDELERLGDGWVLKSAPTIGGGLTARPVPLDPDTTYVARMWRPHPRWHALPDAPLRGVLDSCEALLLASRRSRIRDRQRMSNGVVLVPSELDFEPEPGQQKTTFGQMLTGLMVSAVADESAPSSLAPGVIRGPAELLDKMRKLDLVDKDGEAKDSDKVDRALRRIGSGIDVPPEIITGLKDVKYANAVAIDSTGFRYHIEPKAQAAFAMLTEGYLWERLDALGVDPVQSRRLVLWYDPVEVVTNPNRLPDAKDLHKALAISDRTLRDAGGFDDGDAPSEEELLRRMALTQGSVGDQLAYYLLQILAANAGINLGPAPAAGGAGGGGQGGGGEGDGGGETLPTGEGQQPDEVAAAAVRLALTAAGPRESAWTAQTVQLDLDLRSRLEAAADAAMRRALERAGARVVSKVRNGTALRAKVQGVPTIAVTAAVGPGGLTELGVDPDQLLTGAFDDLAATFRAWCSATWEQGLQAACDLLGLTYYPPEAGALAASNAPPVEFSDVDTAPLSGLDQVALRARFATDVAQAAEGLADDLYAEARDRLFHPTFTAPELGEHDPALAVQPGTIRKALAVAGGANSSNTFGGVDHRGVPVNGSDGDAGMVATGRAFREGIIGAGAVIHGYRWRWGGSPRPFPAHKDLDGQVFADQAHPALAVPDAYSNWLPATSFYPGDHDGCRCATDVLVADPFDGMAPQEAQRVRAAQTARDARGRFVAKASGRASPDRP